jgi:hypothetical protein
VMCVHVPCWVGAGAGVAGGSGLVESYVCSVIIVSAYYGCHLTSFQLENPFGWDLFDIDLEFYTLWVHDETLEVASFADTHAPSYIPHDTRDSSSVPLERE